MVAGEGVGIAEDAEVGGEARVGEEPQGLAGRAEGVERAGEGEGAGDALGEALFVAGEVGEDLGKDAVGELGEAGVGRRLAEREARGEEAVHIALADAARIEHPPADLLDAEARAALPSRRLGAPLGERLRARLEELERLLGTLELEPRRREVDLDRRDLGRVAILLDLAPRILEMRRRLGEVALLARDRA